MLPLLILEAIALAPDAPDPYLNRGIAYEALGDWTKAIADYDQVLALNPEDAIAYNNRGNAKGGQGNWPGAVADYQGAIAYFGLGYHGVLSGLTVGLSKGAAPC